MADEPLSRVEEILEGGSPPLLSRIEKLLQEGGAGGGASPEQIAAAVEAYLDEHGVTVTETDPKSVHFSDAQNLTTEQKSRARQNISAVSSDELESAVNSALDTAKQSGEFDGSDGVSPTVSISAITGGYAVTITDEAHPSGQTFNIMNGAKGDTGTFAAVVSGTNISIADLALAQNVAEVGA